MLAILFKEWMIVRKLVIYVRNHKNFAKLLIVMIISYTQQ